ncbi:hypothetical protein WA171_000362 [Blastocystis sp. BT1]
MTDVYFCRYCRRFVAVSELDHTLQCVECGGEEIQVKNSDDVIDFDIVITNEDGSQRIDIDNGSVFITITQEGGIQFQLTRSSSILLRIVSLLFRHFFTNARVNLDGSLEEGVDMTSIFSNRVIDALRSIHFSSENPRRTDMINSLETRAPKPEELSETCSICLRDYDQEEEIAQLPCNHIFHKECIIQWINMVITWK